MTNVEQQRMLRNNNVITSKFMSEKDARASEKREQDDKAVDLKFKEIAADKSQEAAFWGVIGAALNLLGSLIKGAGSASSGKSSWLDVAVDGLNGLGTVISKYMDYLKAGEEKASVEEDLKRLNAQRCQTDDAVKALDTNPYS
ncbi:MAG: hypothetical protein ACAI44_24000 [Candidatus Sericytochromatia bacterium]